MDYNSKYISDKHNIVNNNLINFDNEEQNKNSFNEPDSKNNPSEDKIIENINVDNKDKVIYNNKFTAEYLDKNWKNIIKTNLINLKNEFTEKILSDLNHQNNNGDTNFNNKNH